jgi:PilZ domain
MGDSSPLSLERRRFVRAGIDQPAMVCLSERDLGGRCLSLSVGGALIKFPTMPVLPRGVLLRLSLPTLDQLAATIAARVIEIFGSRVRVAFDPLPKAVHQAISVEVLSALRDRPRARSSLLS